MANEGINGQEAKRRTEGETRRRNEVDRNNRSEDREKEEKNMEKKKFEEARGISWARIVKGRDQEKEEVT